MPTKKSSLWSFVTIALFVLLMASCQVAQAPSPSPAPAVERTLAPTSSPTAAPSAASKPTPAATAVPSATAKPEPSPTVKPPASPTPAATPKPASPSPSAGLLPGYVAADAVDSASVTFPGVAVSIKAYEARPKGTGPFPAIIVIHENRGLTEHLKDVTRRFANQGYVALGVDLLSRVGGRDAFATDEAAVTAINGLTRDGVRQDMQSAFAYLKGRPYVKADRIGAIGYCWGGGNSILAATQIKELRVSVVYYGSNPANIDDVANISGPVLGVYGEADVRISMNVPALVEAMKKHNKAFEYKIYPGAAHAFFNNTGANYHAQAAAESWPLTLAFLQKNLKS